MMKKYYKFIMITAVLFTAFLSGCDDTDHENKKESLIKDIVSEKGTTKTEDGFEIKYEYHVPELLIDSEDAKDINKDISQTVGNTVNDSLQYIHDGVIPKSMDISWKIYKKDDLIFLVILDKNEEIISQYQVYGYDLKKNKRIGNKEVIENLGMKKEDMIRKIKKKVMQEFDKRFSYFLYQDDDIKLFYDDIFILRSQTLLSIDEESVLLYLDGDTCRAFVKCYTPAGRGYCWEDYQIDLEQENNNKEKTVTDHFITAVLKNNQVNITFKKTEESDMFLSGEANNIKGMNVKYDTQYKVEGLYSDYKDIYIMSVGQEYNPQLILVTKSGHIEFANILSGARAGSICTFPVTGIKNAVKVVSDVRNYKEEDMEISAGTAIVKDKNGREYDLMYSMAAAGQAMPYMLKEEGALVSEESFHSLDSGGEYADVYSMEFRENNQMVFEELLPDVDVTMNYKGNYWCNGMSDEGITYSCLLYTEEKDISSTFVFRYPVKDNDTVEVKIISGTELFDGPDKWVKLYIAYG